MAPIQRGDGFLFVARAMLHRLAVNSTLGDSRRAVWEATEHFLVDDAPALADELSNALLSVSAGFARLRRRLPSKGPLAEAVREVDSAFGESVALARRLSIALRARRDPGAYADVVSTARELARHVAPAMHEGAAFALTCPSPAVLVAMPLPELRSVLATLVRSLLLGLGEAAGELSLSVTETRDGAGVCSAVEIVAGHAALLPGAAAEAAERVRPSVNAAGGAIEPCALPCGGAAVVLSLRAAR